MHGQWHALTAGAGIDRTSCGKATHLIRLIRAFTAAEDAGLASASGGSVKFASTKQASRHSSASRWKDSGSTPAVPSRSTFTRLRQWVGKAGHSQCRQAGRAADRTSARQAKHQQLCHAWRSPPASHALHFTPHCAMVLRRQQAALCTLSQALEQGVQQALRVVKQRMGEGAPPFGCCRNRRQSKVVAERPCGLLVCTRALASICRPERMRART